MPARTPLLPSPTPSSTRVRYRGSQCEVTRISLSAYLPTCLSAYLPICLSAYLPICLFAYLPICLPAYLPGTAQRRLRRRWHYAYAAHSI